MTWLYYAIVLVACYYCVLMSREAFLRLRCPQKNFLKHYTRMFVAVDALRIMLSPHSKEAINTIELLELAVLLGLQTALSYYEALIEEVVCSLVEKQ